MDGGKLGGRRGVRQHPAVRSPELELAIRTALDLVAFLVNRAVVPVAEQREIGKRGRATLRPVAEVMTLAESHATAREATAAVAMLKRPP